MRKLTNDSYSLFESLCTLTQDGLKITMKNFLKNKYDDIVETKEYIYAKGDIPVALCAHMDTVFDEPPTSNDIFYDNKKGVIWSDKGLGADDRAGVFGIIQIILSGLKPHIILTTDEEIGCVGAEALANIDCPFDDLRYIIQLDRRGSDDCVFYECDNPEFVDYVEKFGFVENFGTFSDIYMLCPSWGVAGVNLSIGYVNEHTKFEKLYVGNMLNTIEKVKNMLSTPEDEIPYFNFIPTKYYGSMYSHGCYDWSLDDEDWYWNRYQANNDPQTMTVQCHNCKQCMDSEDAVPVISKTGGVYFMCIDCISQAYDSIEFCKECGNAFEIGDDPTEQYCMKCKLGEHNVL